jgi:hypothetical protein
MTHSAGHRGYKVAAAAASKDDELYGSSYRAEMEDESMPNGMTTRSLNKQQSSENRPAGPDRGAKGRQNNR